MSAMVLLARKGEETAANVSSAGAGPAASQTVRHDLRAKDKRSGEDRSEPFRRQTDRHDLCSSCQPQKIVQDESARRSELAGRHTAQQEAEDDLKPQRSALGQETTTSRFASGISSSASTTEAPAATGYRPASASVGRRRKEPAKISVRTADLSFTARTEASEDRPRGKSSTFGSSGTPHRVSRTSC